MAFGKIGSDEQGDSLMAEINITPLLDLAFVLLIIFIITTPMLEGSLNMNLPGQSAKPDPAHRPKPEDIRTVEIDRAGNFRLQKRPLTLDQVAELAATMLKRMEELAVVDWKTRASTMASVRLAIKRSVKVFSEDFDDEQVQTILDWLTDRLDSGTAE